MLRSLVPQFTGKCLIRRRITLESKDTHLQTKPRFHNLFPADDYREFIHEAQDLFDKILNDLRNREAKLIENDFSWEQEYVKFFSDFINEEKTSFIKILTDLQNRELQLLKEELKKEKEFGKYLDYVISQQDKEIEERRKNDPDFDEASYQKRLAQKRKLKLNE